MPCTACAPSSPITDADVAMGAPAAEAELAVGFFGSRYDRATPAEREYLHAMATLGGPAGAAVGKVSVPKRNPSGPCAALTTSIRTTGIAPSITQPGRWRRTISA